MREAFRRLGLLAAGMVAATGGWTDSAFAQGSEASDDTGHGGLEEIVVTAQRKAENLQSVPITVNVATGARLESAGIADSLSLQSLAPGLVITRTSSAAAGIYIRGVGTKSAATGLELSVNTYADDRYVAGHSAVLFDLLDVERVEVLKGPQGVLYGRNATGGAIRIITKPVTQNFEGEVRASYGNYDDVELRGVINTPITENFAVRLAGLVHKRDGFAKNMVASGPDDVNDRDFWQVHGKALLTISDDWTAQFIVDYWKQKDTNGLGYVVVGPLDLNRAVVSGAQYSTRRNRVATGLDVGTDQHEFSGQFRVDGDIGIGKLALISTYGNYSGTNVTDLDGTSGQFLDLVYSKYPQRSFSQEVQLVSDSAGPLSYTVGANYFHNTGEGRSQIRVPILYGVNGNNVVKTNAWAAFAQVTYDITDQLSVILGGRYSTEKKNILVTDDPEAVAVGLNRAILPYRDSVRFNKFTPKAVLQWQYAPESMVFASFTRGFKSGGYDSPAPPPSNVLRPEVLDSYEIGWKTDLFDRTVRLNLAGFYYDYKDLQVVRQVVSDGVTVPRTANAANATVKGVEFEFTWQPTRAFTLALNGAYIRGKYDDYRDAGAPTYRADTATPGDGLGIVTIPFDASGRRLFRTPRFSGSAFASYDVDLGSGHMPISVTYAYRSSFDFEFATTENTRFLRQSGYGLLSANISYSPDGDPWTLSLFGRNLTDEKYFSEVAPTSVGLRGQFGDPRTYGMAFAMKF